MLSRQNSEKGNRNQVTSRLGCYVKEMEKIQHEGNRFLIIYPCIFTPIFVIKWLPVVNHKADKCY